MTDDARRDAERGNAARDAAREAAARDAATVRSAAERATRSPGSTARTNRPAEPEAPEEELVEGPPHQPLQPRRAPNLRLARVHLRTGALSLARAELETLAGQQALDAEGILDLAEVRWRTGDLAGAGDAASSYLAGGGEDALGFVIAAEAAAATDRPAEARRLAGRALERTEASLDAIFAGIPRGLVWPHDTWAEQPASREGRGLGFGQPGNAAAQAIETDRPAQAGLWESAAAMARGGEDGAPHLEAGARALLDGEPATAAMHLAVALRLSPALAPAVVEAIGNHREAQIELVRGDALRVLGYELDARHAYMAVAAALAAAAPALGRDARSAVSEAADDAEPGAGAVPGMEGGGHPGRDANAAQDGGQAASNGGHAGEA